LSTSPENIKDAILRVIEIGNYNRDEKERNGEVVC